MSIRRVISTCFLVAILLSTSGCLGAFLEGLSGKPITAPATENQSESDAADTGEEAPAEPAEPSTTDRIAHGAGQVVRGAGNTVAATGGATGVALWNLLLTLLTLGAGGAGLQKLTTKREGG